MSAHIFKINKNKNNSSMDRRIQAEPSKTMAEKVGDLAGTVARVQE